MVYRPRFVHFVERSQFDVRLPEAQFRKEFGIGVPVVLTSDGIDERVDDGRHPRQHGGEHVQIGVRTVVVDHVGKHQRQEANQEAYVDGQQRQR